MAVATVASQRPEQRRTTRPRPLSNYASYSEPPHKKLRYVPGGPGGGGRYIDDKDISALLITDSNPPLARVSDTAVVIRSPSIPRPAPRCERPPPEPKYTSASAAAVAMTQSEGYKPREERSWEEFHPDLDVDLELAVFAADEVDGFSDGATPHVGLGLLNQAASENGMNAAVDAALLAQQTAPIAPEGVDVEPPSLSPPKRRVGRPSKASMLSGLGSPPALRIVPIPTQNPKEKLNLQKPIFNKVSTFASFEQDKSVSINYVDKSLANIGFQESEMFVRPEKTYIRGGEGSIEEELDLELVSRAEREGVTVLGRVEYDMDEQDERWLDFLNADRKLEGVEGIKPAIFEITVTQIEKEWHALEKRE